MVNCIYKFYAVKYAFAESNLLNKIKPNFGQLQFEN